MANHAALIRADNDGLSVTRRGRRFIEFALPDVEQRRKMRREHGWARSGGRASDDTGMA